MFLKTVQATDELPWMPRPPRPKAHLGDEADELQDAVAVFKRRQLTAPVQQVPYLGGQRVGGAKEKAVSLWKRHCGGGGQSGLISGTFWP